MGATYFDDKACEWRYEDEQATLLDYGYLDLFQQARHAGQLESCARSSEPEILAPDLDL